jgi:hypothetical protein
MKDEILTSAMNCTEAQGNTSDFCSLKIQASLHYSKVFCLEDRDSTERISKGVPIQLQISKKSRMQPENFS